MKDMETSKYKYVLAMYDVRGKQNFIYRSTHIKEIIGGSDIIRTIFQRELYSAAKEYRNTINSQVDKEAEAIYDYPRPNANMNTIEEVKFSFDMFMNRMSDPQYIGEIVYDGGGNFLILYRDKETCKEVTYRFTKKVIEKYTSLKVVCTYIENLNPEKYHGTKDDPGDYERLYARHRYTENEQLMTMPYGTLPIVQADYLTSMPLTCFGNRTAKSKIKSKLTTESAAKYDRYKELKDRHGKLNGMDIPDEVVLDKLVTKKGDESLLAVIYMDGNNMGASIQKRLEGVSDYDTCVSVLREFSSEIQNVFIDKQADSFRAGSKEKMRLVIGAGDEVTVICNARDAYSVVKAYMEKLKSINSDGKTSGYVYSSCAGIAIFHSHAPYADVYRIAEECCESAKAVMKEYEIQDICMLDYHYCQGAIGVSLKQIRKNENTSDCIRPWLITDMRTTDEIKTSSLFDSNIVHREQVIKMVKILNIFGRGNTKGLNFAAQRGNSAFELEIRRIEAHLTSYQKKLLEVSECDMKRDIYDDIDNARKLIEAIVIVYDLWNDEWKEEMNWKAIVAKAEGRGE